MELRIVLGRETAWMSLLDPKTGRFFRVMDGDKDNFPLYFMIFENKTSMKIGHLARRCFREEIRFLNNGVIGGENSTAQIMGPEFLHSDSRYSFEGQEFHPSHLIAELSKKGGENQGIESIRVIAHPCWADEELSAIKEELESFYSGMDVEVSSYRDELPLSSAYFAFVFNNGMQVGYWDSQKAWNVVHQAPMMGQDLREENAVGNIIQQLRRMGCNFNDAGMDIEPLERRACRIYLDDNGALGKIESMGSFEGIYDAPTVRRNSIRVSLNREKLMDMQATTLLRGAANGTRTKLDAARTGRRRLLFMGDAFMFAEFQSIFRECLEKNGYSVKFHSTKDIVESLLSGKHLFTPEVPEQTIPSSMGVNRMPPADGFVPADSLDMASLCSGDLVAIDGEKQGKPTTYMVFRYLGNSCFIIEESNHSEFPAGMSVRTDGAWQLGQQISRTISRIRVKHCPSRPSATNVLDLASLAIGSRVILYAGSSVHTFEKVGPSQWKIVDTTSGNLHKDKGKVVEFLRDRWQIGEMVEISVGYHTSGLDRFEIIPPVNPSSDVLDFSSLAIGSRVTLYAGSSVHTFEKVGPSQWRIVDSTSGKVRNELQAVGSVVEFARDRWLIGEQVGIPTLNYYTGSLTRFEVSPAAENPQNGSGFTVA